MLCVLIYGCVVVGLSSRVVTGPNLGANHVNTHSRLLFKASTSCNVMSVLCVLIYGCMLCSGCSGGIRSVDGTPVAPCGRVFNSLIFSLLGKMV